MGTTKTREIWTTWVDCISVNIWVWYCSIFAWHYHQGKLVKDTKDPSVLSLQMHETPTISLKLERQQGFGFWKGWRTGRLRGNEWVQERERAWLMKSRSAWRKASRRRYGVPNARVHRGKFFPSIILFSNGQERIMTIWKLRKWRFGGQQLVGHKYRCRGCCWGSRVLWHTLGGKCIRQPFGEHFGRHCSNCEFPSRYWFWRNTCVCILRGRKRDVHWTVQKLGYKSHVY